MNLTLLTRKPQNYPIDFPGDVERIREALHKAGYDASDSDIDWAWTEYSTDRAAGWLNLDGNSDEELVNYVMIYLQPKEPYSI